MPRTPNAMPSKRNPYTDLVLTAAEFGHLHFNTPGPSGVMGGYQQLENRLMELAATNPKTVAGQSYVISVDDARLARLVRYLKMYGGGGPNGRLRAAFARAVSAIVGYVVGVRPSLSDRKQEERDRKLLDPKVRFIELTVQDSDTYGAGCGDYNDCTLNHAFKRLYPGCEPRVHSYVISITYKGFVHHLAHTKQSLEIVALNDDGTLTIVGDRRLRIPKIDMAKSQAGLHLAKTRSRISELRTKRKAAGIAEKKYVSNLRKLAAERAGMVGKRLKDADAALPV